MRLRNQLVGITKKVLAITIIAMSANAVSLAQFTFMGDYDRTFGAPLGSYMDGQNPDPTAEEFQLNFMSGALLADGSIIAGGRFVNTALSADFYLRKLTAAGTIDTSFGPGGLARTNFFTDNNNVPSSDFINVVKVQGDGKIIAAGNCFDIRSPNVGTIPTFGNDVCVIRYNADGTIDSSFGNSTVVTGGGINGQGIPNPTFNFQVGPGRFSTQTGLISQPGSPRFGTEGRFYDAAIQADGKIVLVGETRNFYNPGDGFGGLIVRLNSNGTLDTTFGSGGIALWNAPQGPTNCYGARGFHRMLLQADGRIVAVGYSEITQPENCSAGKRFAVTRWTAAGQLETVKHLDNPTNVGVRDEAAGVLATREGSQLLVSGRLGGLATMVRLSFADLSIDTTFGTAGIRRYNMFCNPSGEQFGGTLYIKAIQPDGKILALDVDAGTPMSRFNPDGSPDLSYGNAGQPGGVTGGCGRVRLNMLYYNGVNHMFTANHVLQRANGRTIYLGATPQGPFNEFRAAVSQQNTLLKNGNYSDFNNDGKSEIAVYRPADGVWHQLNSANGNYTAVKWGVSTDRIAPADYDGDGRTDHAIYRDGVWYIYSSSSASVRIENFGLAGDMPRPADFDGDGRADVAVFRPSNGTWYLLNSSNGQFAAVQFGANGDHPMLGDYDADGRTDFTVFRPSTSRWFTFRSSDNQIREDAFGTAGDIPLSGDYNGDSLADLAVFRPSNRTWYIARPTGIPGQNYDAIAFGISSDTPVPADYDNDGKTDIAVYRTGVWWISHSGSGQVMATNFGVGSDRPIPAAYHP